MKRSLPLIAFALGCIASGALAKDRPALIDLSVTAEGVCQAKIADTLLAVDPAELDAKLPALLPNRKAPLRFTANYEKAPDRCFGPMLSSLQRLGFDSISFETAQPPLDSQISILDKSPQ